MNKKILGLILIVMLSPPWETQAEVYKWRDANGKLHFSDSPPNDTEAEKLDEKELASRISSFTNVSVQITPIDFGVNKQVNRNEVVMYSTARCRYCAKARAYFAEQGIAYIEKKIDESKAYRKEFDDFGGNGVPVIFAGKYRMNGFSEGNFAKMYAKFTR